MKTECNEPSKTVCFNTHSISLYIRNTLLYNLSSPDINKINKYYKVIAITFSRDLYKYKRDNNYPMTQNMSLYYILHEKVKLVLKECPV